MMRELEVPLAEYLPDLPDYRNPGATVATNVVPLDMMPTGAVSYGQFKALSAVSDALDNRCRGILTGRDKTGNVYTYAGDSAKLYSNVSNVWSDVSVGGGYSLSSDDYWEFTQFQNDVIAVSYNETTQGISFGGANFANYITSTRTPQAVHCATVRDFVMLGNCFDATDDAQPQRVWWSAIGDPKDFDPDPATQCDYEDLSGSHGECQKVVGGEYATIFMEEAIFRATYEGGATVFRFDEIITGIGALAPNSVVKFGRMIYFLDSSGFYAFDGVQATPIGRNKVDRTILADMDSSNYDRITSTVDPTNSLVIWAYPQTGNGGVCNRLAIYNWRIDKWSIAEVDTEFLINDRTKGSRLDSTWSATITNIDTAGITNIDDDQYKGGVPRLSAVDTAHKLGTFTGSALAATIETGEVQPFPALRSYVNEIRPYVDGTGATTTIQVGSRELHTAANSYGSALSLDSLGRVTTRDASRYMRFRLNISGGFDDAQGIRIKATSAGIR